VRTGTVVDLDEYRLRKGMELSFGQAMAIYMERRGVTQQQLVNITKLKIHRSVVSKWKTRALNVTPENAVAVAKALAAPSLLEYFCNECPVKQYLESIQPKPAA
jgi:hypothetical protein